MILLLINSLSNEQLDNQHFVQADYNETCLNTSYEQEYDGEFYRQVIRISQSGFERYINQNLQYAQIYLEHTIIPDITLSLGSISMYLRDIVISDSQFPDCHITTQPDYNSLYVAIQGLNMTLEFSFQLQQQIYPYMADNGTGVIILQNIQLTGDVLEYISDTCIGAEQVDAENFSLLISQLLITLDSKNKYLYDGILTLLTSTLLNLFNTELQPVLQEAFLQVANQGIASGELYAFPHGQNNSVVEDQRFVQIQVFQGYFDSHTMGTLCYIVDNVCTGSIPETDNFEQMQQWSTNNDVQYFLASDTFLSQFQVIYQQQDQYLDYEQSEQCDNVQFVNTGITYRCYFIIENQNTIIDFFGKFSVLNIKQSQEALYILSIYHQIDDYEIIDGNISDDFNMTSLIDNFNNCLNITSPGINNGNYVNDKECFYKRWSDDWSEFSCNFDGSMSI